MQPSPLRPPHASKTEVDISKSHSPGRQRHGPHPLQPVLRVVSNADQLAHEELAHPEVVALLEDHWGPEVLNEQQQPDRGKIAAIVFQDDIERAWLERVLHPRVIARRNAQFADAPADAPAHVIDAPLLVESGGAGECDHLIFVRTPRDKRLERVAQSRDWNEQEYGQRELAQMDLDKKEALAGFVINNDCDLEELRTRVEDVRPRTSTGRA